MSDVESRRTAVIDATTTWQEFPALWPRLLDEVWECLRTAGVHRGCRNIMLYQDSVPNVEVGVLLGQPCPLGTAAVTVHRGPFGGVVAAHDAIRDWCATHGHQPAGPRWEVYGPHNDDPAQQWTEVSWLLSAQD